MSDATPQSVHTDCRKYIKSRIDYNTFNTFNNVDSSRKLISLANLERFYANLKQYTNQFEKTVAAILTEMDSRLNLSMSEHVDSVSKTIAEHKEAVSKTIEYNEETTAAILTGMDDRLRLLEDNQSSTLNFFIDDEGYVVFDRKTIVDDEGYLVFNE